MAFTMVKIALYIFSISKQSKIKLIVIFPCLQLLYTAPS